jgi:methylmalonyl-CoA mutase N-terminal domain/subunit
MFEKRVVDEINDAVLEWTKKNEERFGAERKEFMTESGIPIKRLYTPADLAERKFDYMKDVGLPGEYPYVRGNSPVGYRGKLWGITAYGGKGTPEESNALWKAQVAAGADTISVAYDLPSQLGLDPEDEKAKGEVGRVGISMVSQKDWETAWDGIDFGKVGVYQVFNAPAIFGLANHITLAANRGIGVDKLRGIQQNDVLKEYMARGNFIFPPAPSIRLTGDILHYVGMNMPRYQAITVCGVHQSERGANNIHELALMMINATAYLQAAVDRGVDIDSVAPGVMFFPAGDHFVFFEEIAKLRAMRRMWGRILKERFKAKKPESVQCRIYTAEGGTGLHREQYLNNVARIALATLASALSGVELIDTRSYDEQFGIPTTEAQVNTIRTQNVVAYETGVDLTVDPLGGSYFIESLTSETEERAWKVIDEIERQGGIVRCIETGYVQRMIARDAYEWQKRFESGEIKRVGVNIFESSDGEAEKPVRVYRSDPAIERQRVDAVVAMKKARDNEKVRKCLDELTALAREQASASNNLVPAVVESVRAYATVGEVAGALRKAWGEFREPAIA